MDEEDLVTKSKLMEENSSKDSFGESYYETSFSSDYISFLGTIDLGLGIGDCFWSQVFAFVCILGWVKLGLDLFVFIQSLFTLFHLLVTLELYMLLTDLIETLMFCYSLRHVKLIYPYLMTMNVQLFIITYYLRMQFIFVMNLKVLR